MTIPAATPPPRSDDPGAVPGLYGLAHLDLPGIAARVQEVPGVLAVVLGGSRARGTHHPDSDVDLGLYYAADRLDPDALQDVAREIDGPGTEVAGPGGWGPWVDGGSWLRRDGVAVDLILRDVDRVAAQRDRAVRGEFAVHAQTGHPFGFLDVAYAGEVATCRPLSDPDGMVAELARGLDPYPPALRDALVEHLWSVAFEVDGAAKAAPRGDSAYVQLACARGLLWCAHAWHAAAGVWATTEKGLLPWVRRLPRDGATAFADDAEAALAAGDPVDVFRRTAALVTRTREALTGSP